MRGLMRAWRISTDYYTIRTGRPVAMLLERQIVTTSKATPRFTGLAAIGALVALALAILACGGGTTSSGSGGSSDATKAPAKVGVRLLLTMSQPRSSQ
jgi:hypothetical protein